MKTILFIAVIAMVLTGFATADPVDMSIYDRNGDGVIDADERVILDIDIEDCRVTVDEAYVIDSYTTDGSIILNEEFTTAFLNPEARFRGDTEVTVTPAPVIDEPVAESTVEPVVDEPVPEVMVPEDDAGGNLTLMMIVGMVLLAGIIMYMYSKQNKE